MNGAVLAVSLSPKHGFSKQPQLSIRLLKGRGVEGDAHCGETVQHLYLKRKNASAPNRMQVHLLQAELFADLKENGIALHPGELGENITTQGIDLLQLPVGTRLHLGATAVVELTGLRTPCQQIENFRHGLLKQMVIKHDDAKRSARAGAMSIVLEDGSISPGDTIRVELPMPPHQPMTMM